MAIMQLMEVLPRGRADKRRHRNRSRSLQERADNARWEIRQLLEQLDPLDALGAAMFNKLCAALDDDDLDEVDRISKQWAKTHGQLADTLKGLDLDTDDDSDDDLPDDEDDDEEEDVDPPQSSCGQTRAMPSMPKPPAPRLSKVPAAMRSPVEHVIARLANRQRGPGRKAVRSLVETLDTRETSFAGSLSRRASAVQLTEQRGVGRSAAKLLGRLDLRASNRVARGASVAA